MTDLNACPTEDSSNCYWDALHMGNGQGTGFVDIDGVVFPLVNEPSWNVTVTMVHYNCDDFTLPECQPYADYAPVVTEPTPTPEAPVTTTTQPIPEPPVELAATGIDLAPIAYLGLTILLTGVLLRLRAIAIRKDRS